MQLGNIEWKWERGISKYVQNRRGTDESFHFSFLRLKTQDHVSSPREFQAAGDIQFK